MEAVRTWAVELSTQLGPTGGPLAYALFLALYMAACLPPEPIEFLPGFLFGWTTGAAVLIAGKLLGVALSMLIGRYLFRERIRAFAFAKFPVVRRIAVAIEREGFWAVVLVRGLALPAAVKNYGVSACVDVGILQNCLASAVIVVPHSLVWSWIGQAAATVSSNYHEADTAALLKQIMPDTYVLVALGAVVGGFALYIVRNVAKRVNFNEPLPDEVKRD